VVNLVFTIFQPLLYKPVCIQRFLLFSLVSSTGECGLLCNVWFWIRFLFDFGAYYFVLTYSNFWVVPLHFYESHDEGHHV
jgi:hypothetical protein